MAFEETIRTFRFSSNVEGRISEGLFHPLKVFDEGREGGGVLSVGACELDGRNVQTALRERHLDLQRHWDLFPGSRGPAGITGEGASRGVEVLCDVLWLWRKDPVKTRLALMQAGFEALRPVIGRSVAYRDLRKATHEEALRLGASVEWHHRVVVFLPGHVTAAWKGDDRLLTKPAEVLGMLRDLVAESFKRTVFTVTVAGDRRDPEIERILAREYLLTVRRQAMERKARVDRRVAEERMRQKYPRRQDWPVARDELMRLVWEKPRLQLAKEFGVSDVAIAKHCRKEGINMPPRGYWARMKAQSKGAGGRSGGRGHSC